jgi:hypothetical protein
VLTSDWYRTLLVTTIVVTLLYELVGEDSVLTDGIDEGDGNV